MTRIFEPICRTISSPLVRCGLFAAILLLLTPVIASACPTCKDGLAGDPEAAGLARGIYYSILFMLAMPALILTGLGSLFYFEIRRARKRQLAGKPAA
jgi:heme/copper-type cytochrome/quinol oxidase subunit 2